MKKCKAKKQTCKECGITTISRFETCHACRLFNKVEYHEEWKVRKPEPDEKYLVRWDNEKEMFYESLESLERMRSLTRLSHITVHWFKKINPQDYKVKVTRKVCCEWCKNEFTPYDDIKGNEGYYHEDCEEEMLWENFGGYSLTYEEMIEDIKEIESRLIIK